MNTTNADYFTFNAHNSLLLIGKTGSGKSFLVHTLLKKFESAYDSDEMQYVLFDLKQVEFQGKSDYQNAYLYKDVIVDPRLGLEQLESLASEVELRLKSKLQKPLLFIYIEECDMAMLNQKRFDMALIKIIKSARDANVKLIYSTSRSSDEAISRLLRDSFDLILSGRLGSTVDYETLRIPPMESLPDYAFVVTER